MLHTPLARAKVLLGSSCIQQCGRCRRPCILFGSCGIHFYCRAGEDDNFGSSSGTQPSFRIPAALGAARTLTFGVPSANWVWGAANGVYIMGDAANQGPNALQSVMSAGFAAAGVDVTPISVSGSPGDPFLIGNCFIHVLAWLDKNKNKVPSVCSCSGSCQR